MLHGSTARHVIAQGPSLALVETVCQALDKEIARSGTFRSYFRCGGNRMGLDMEAGGQSGKAESRVSANR